MKAVNMEKLMLPFKKHKPDLVSPFIEEYCVKSEQPGHDKKFNYGFGSLKWAMQKLQELKSDNIPVIFYGILCEHKLDILNQYDIQFKVQKSFFLRKYRIFHNKQKSSLMSCFPAVTIPSNRETRDLTH